MGPNVNVSNDIVIAQSSYTWAFNLLIKARLDPVLTATGYSVIDNANVTFDAAAGEYYFDYFTVKCSDSVVRTGRIHAKLTGDLLQQGSFCHIFFQNYSEDYQAINGNDSIYNKGVNASNLMVFDDVISNGLISIYPGNGAITFNAVNQFKTNSTSLAGGQDILFLITGSSSGLSSGNYAFTASVRDSLLDSFSCPWIKGGIIDVHVPGVDVTDCTIDFIAGDGCSQLLYYYINGILIKLLKNKDYLKN